MSEKFYFNTSVAFANFKKWAEGKTFNEILGCAKLNIDGLMLRKDVDEFNGNQIAFLTYYADERGNSTLVEVSFINNEVVFFNYFDDEKHEPFKNLDYEEQIKAICEYVGFSDEDRIAEEVWNEYVDNAVCDPTKPLIKIWVNNMENVDEIVKSLTEAEAKAVICNMCFSNIDSNDRYFFIDNNLKWNTTQSVWWNIDLEGLWAYLNKYWKKDTSIERYGRKWEISAPFVADMERAKENEYRLVTMGNGDIIFANNVEGYLALKTTDKIYYSSL